MLLRMVFELTQGNPDTAEAMRHTMARGLPDLVGYLSRQMEAGRLRRMHPILAFQLLAGPIVVHQLTRPLAEPLIAFSQSESELLDEILQAWLRASLPVERGLSGVMNPPKDVLTMGTDRTWAEAIQYLRWEEELGKKYGGH